MLLWSDQSSHRGAQRGDLIKTHADGKRSEKCHFVQAGLLVALGLQQICVSNHSIGEAFRWAHQPSD